MRISVCKIFFVTLFMASGSAEVNLSYADPESFTDFENSHSRQVIDTDYFTKRIVSDLNREAEKALPTDSVLRIEFSDIDLAGEFEPWQKVPLDDVRIYKSNYAPATKFSYQLFGANENLLVEGEAKIRVLGYQDKYARRRSVIDPYYYERRMIEDWIKKELVAKLETADS